MPFPALVKFSRQSTCRTRLCGTRFLKSVGCVKENLVCRSSGFTRFFNLFLSAPKFFNISGLWFAPSSPLTCPFTLNRGPRGTSKAYFFLPYCSSNSRSLLTLHRSNHPLEIFPSIWSCLSSSSSFPQLDC